MALFIVTATLVKLRDLLLFFFFFFSFRTGDINPPFTAVGGGVGGCVSVYLHSSSMWQLHQTAYVQQSGAPDNMYCTQTSAYIAHTHTVTRWYFKKHTTRQEMMMMMMMHPTSLRREAQQVCLIFQTTAATSNRDRKQLERGQRHGISPSIHQKSMIPA